MRLIAGGGGGGGGDGEGEGEEGGDGEEGWDMEDLDLPADVLHGSGGSTAAAALGGSMAFVAPSAGGLAWPKQPAQVSLELGHETTTTSKEY